MGCEVAVATPAGVVLGPARRAAVLKRLASVLVLLPVFLLIVVKAPAFLFNTLVVIASAAALWELLRLLEQAGRPVDRGLALGAGTAVTAAFAASPLLDPLAVPTFTLLVAAVAVLAAPVWRGTPDLERAANTLLAVMYVGWLLGFGILLHHTSPRGDELVLFVVGVTWVGETAAYVVGSTLGRHALAPVISPRKTVEGALAQVAGSIATGGLLGAWLLPDCGLGFGLGAGGLLGVVGQFGDLAESAIKRSAGTKDTGGLIPGHGGVLDRIDSLLFNLPAFYYVSLVAGCR
ncbi:MAG TPA: phosphatidate cytidylyltransferase [Methylomirabilota bacterium]|nr:phosphatidate cytidylyltransferase [Methylomirabilota bacterium]